MKRSHEQDQSQVNKSKSNSVNSSDNQNQANSQIIQKSNPLDKDIKSYYKNNYEEQDSLSRAIAENEAELQEISQQQAIKKQAPIRERGRDNQDKDKSISKQKVETKVQNIDDSGCWDNGQQQKNDQSIKQDKRNQKANQNKQQNKVKVKDDQSQCWDKQSQKSSSQLTNTRNRGRDNKKDQEQAEIQPDKAINESGWFEQTQKKQSFNEIKQTQKQNLGVNRRGNRGNQSDNKQIELNLINGDRHGQRDFNENGNRNYRNYNNNRDFNQEDRRGGGGRGRNFNGQRGGYRGGFRGGREGFNRNDNRNDNKNDQSTPNNHSYYPNNNNNFNTNRNFPRNNNEDNNERNFKKNDNQFGEFNALSNKTIIQPDTYISWPQVSVWIRKCRLTLTLRTLREHEADCLFFPFYDTSFNLYPSSLINKSGTIRKKIQEKLETDYFDKKPCVKQIKQFGSFRYVAFVKIEKDKQQLGILKLLKSLFDSEAKIQTYVIPICRDFGDFYTILNELEKYIEHLQLKKPLIKQIYLSTKDPQYFKLTSNILLQKKIFMHIDANRFCVQ